MDSREKHLDESIEIIMKKTKNKSLQKMASIIQKMESSGKKVDSETLDLLGQYTYEDYANKEEKKGSRR